MVRERNNTHKQLDIGAMFRKQHEANALKPAPVANEDDMDEDAEGKENAPAGNEDMDIEDIGVVSVNTNDPAEPLRN